MHTASNAVASVSDVSMLESSILPPQELIVEIQQQQQQQQQQQNEDGDVSSSRASSVSDLNFIDSRAEVDHKENSKSSLPQHVPVSAPMRPAHISKKALKFLGADPEQVARTKALKQLGLTEQDLYLAGPLFETPEQRERAQMAFEKRGYSPKLLSLTGMTEAQILRRKALKCLGVTEPLLEMEREARLAAMGGCSNKSISHTHHNTKIHVTGDNISACLHGVKPPLISRVGFAALPFVPHRAHPVTSV